MGIRLCSFLGVNDIPNTMHRFAYPETHTTSVTRKMDPLIRCMVWVLFNELFEHALCAQLLWNWLYEEEMMGWITNCLWSNQVCQLGSCKKQRQSMRLYAEGEESTTFVFFNLYILSYVESQDMIRCYLEGKLTISCILNAPCIFPGRWLTYMGLYSEPVRSGDQGQQIFFIYPKLILWRIWCMSLVVASVPIS